MLKKTLFVLIMLVMVNSLLLAQPDTLRADITSDTTLLAGIHIVSAQDEGDNIIEVTNNATLTLNPGVILQFMSERSIRVLGGSELSAHGTDENPITFTSTAQITAGYWGAVFFYGDSLGTAHYATGNFSHCIFEYGGNAESAYLQPNGPITLIGYGNVEVDTCTKRWPPFFGQRV